MPMAYLELMRIRNLSAFNLIGAKMRKINQYARGYTFLDGSTLRLYKDGRGQSFRPDGLCDCILQLQTNAFGRG